MIAEHKLERNRSSVLGVVLIMLLCIVGLVGARQPEPADAIDDNGRDKKKEVLQEEKNPEINKTPSDLNPLAADADATPKDQVEYIGVKLTWTKVDQQGKRDTQSWEKRFCTPGEEAFWMVVTEYLFPVTDLTHVTNYVYRDTDANVHESKTREEFNIWSVKVGVILHLTPTLIEEEISYHGRLRLRDAAQYDYNEKKRVRSFDSSTAYFVNSAKDGETDTISLKSPDGNTLEVAMMFTLEQQKDCCPDKTEPIDSEFFVGQTIPTR